MAEEVAAPNRVSGSELVERLDRLEHGQRDLEFLVRRAWNAQPYVFYKPKQGRGAALELHLRVTAPVYVGETGRRYLRNVEGGLYLTLAAEKAEKDSRGNAQFEWRDREPPMGKLVAGLGVPDVSAWLLALRSRWARRPLPTGGAFTETGVKFFHRTEAGTMVVKYDFDEEGGELELSRAKEWKRGIRLLVVEELVLERYLERALDVLLATGR